MEEEVKPLGADNSKMTEHIKTEESEEDSEVEMKVTSIKVGEKELNDKGKRREEKERKG